MQKGAQACPRSFLCILLLLVNAKEIIKSTIYVKKTMKKNQWFERVRGPHRCPTMTLSITN